MLSLSLCRITNSDIDSSRRHPSHDWHRKRTSPAITLPITSLSLCRITNSDIDSSRRYPSHDWHRTRTSPAITLPIFTVFRATSCHWWPTYLVDSKSSEFVVKVSTGTIFSPCNIKLVWLHQIVQRYTFTFQWLFRVQLVTNSNSQISEVIALNPATSKFFGYIRSCNVTLLLFIGCFGCNW